MSYTKTTWENGVTPVNADNMNKIEDELEALDQASGGISPYGYNLTIQSSTGGYMTGYVLGVWNGTYGWHSFHLDGENGTGRYVDGVSVSSPTTFTYATLIYVNTVYIKYYVSGELHTMDGTTVNSKASFEALAGKFAVCFQDTNISWED